MKTGRGQRYPLHKCPIAGCVHRIPRQHLACSDHWAMVPKGLQIRINEQRTYGYAWKCHPTQDYIDLRSRALQIVNAACAAKYSRPQGEQLPLLPPERTR